MGDIELEPVRRVFYVHCYTENGCRISNATLDLEECKKYFVEAHESGVFAAIGLDCEDFTPLMLN